MGDHNLDLTEGLESVWELEDAGDLEVDFELGSEFDLELEGQLEPATAVFLVALALFHLLVDPGVFDLEIAELHAGCLEEWGGEGCSQGPPSEAHDPI